MVMHRDFPLAKIGCSKLRLIDALTSLCLPVVRLCPYIHLKTEQRTGGDALKKKKKSFLCLCVCSTYIGMQFSIKTSAVSISLEIYRILTAFSFFLDSSLVARLNQGFENVVPTVSTEVTVLH